MPDDFDTEKVEDDSVLRFKGFVEAFGVSVVESVIEVNRDSEEETGGRAGVLELEGLTGVDLAVEKSSVEEIEGSVTEVYISDATEDPSEELDFFVDSGEISNSIKKLDDFVFDLVNSVVFEGSVDKGSREEDSVLVVLEDLEELETSLDSVDAEDQEEEGIDSTSELDDVVEESPVVIPEMSVDDSVDEGTVEKVDDEASVGRLEDEVKDDSALVAMVDVDEDVLGETPDSIEEEDDLGVDKDSVEEAVEDSIVEVEGAVRDERFVDDEESVSASLEEVDDSTDKEEETFGVADEDPI